MILVAPTSFKGTHSAAQVTAAMVRAAARCSSDVIARPVSDGGPGLLDALMAAQPGRIEFVNVRGPQNETVTARILVQQNRAVIESADAGGLQLVPSALRDPTRTSTYGVGELILAAAEIVNDVVIGLGGTATIDGGLGMKAALADRVVLPRITALYDVRNPLCGANGAARIFGPQKGATPAQVQQLDRQLREMAEDIERATEVDVANLEGAGAAGGLGAGLVGFAGATLVSGSTWVLRETGVDSLLERAALLITGEGAYDAQSAMGKITGDLIARAEQRGVPVLLIAGSVSGEFPQNVYAVAGGADLSENDIERLLADALPRLLSV